MNAMDRLVRSLNGGIAVITADHARVKAMLHTTVARPLLLGGGVDFGIVTAAGEAWFQLLDLEPKWCFPVGSDKFPIEKWYIASKHLDRHSRWAGGIHTGIDYNVEVPPRGDIDRGQPVFAITDGVIYATGYSQIYLGSVVIEIEHHGKPLWVRYWHLANDDLFKSWRPGLDFVSGQELGHIGSYLRGGDHLHWDMCIEPFHPLTWWSRMSGSSNEEKLARWVDPIGVLKAHLSPDVVDASLRIG